MRLQWDDEEKPVFVLTKSPLPSDKLTLQWNMTIFSYGRSSN